MCSGVRRLACVDRWTGWHTFVKCVLAASPTKCRAALKSHATIFKIYHFVASRYVYFNCPFGDGTVMVASGLLVASGSIPHFIPLLGTGLLVASGSTPCLPLICISPHKVTIFAQSIHIIQAGYFDIVVCRTYLLPYEMRQKALPMILN